MKRKNMYFKKLILIFILIFIFIISGCGNININNHENNTNENSTENEINNNISSNSENEINDKDTTNSNDNIIEENNDNKEDIIDNDTSDEDLVVTISPSDKDFFFGISPFFSDALLPIELERYIDMNIKSLRIHLQLYKDWTKYETLLTQAEELGIEVMMLVSYESYKSKGKSINLGWGPIYQYDDYMDLIDVLEIAVPHFSEYGVDAWEIWNEQNGMWNIEAEKYAQLITTVYEKFKYTDKWDPDATVVFGGIDAVNVNFSRGINGGAAYYLRKFYASDWYKSFKEKYGHSPFDALSIHPYNTIDVNDDLSVQHNYLESAILGVAKKTMNNNGDENIPIWITELGDADPDDARNAEKLELYVRNAYELPYVTRLHWFKYTYPGNRGHSFYSLVMQSGEVRESFTRLQSLIQELTAK